MWRLFRFIGPLFLLPARESSGTAEYVATGSIDFVGSGSLSYFNA